MSTTNTPAQAVERPYGPMSRGINAAHAERMNHSALVLNRAADVFYCEAGHDLLPAYQPHSTPVQLAAFALAMQMEGQGAHPLHDSFGWRGDSSFGDEMGALQDAVTSEEWQQIDDLAREYRAQFLLARLVTLAFASGDVPLADMVAGELPGAWDSISGGEIADLARLASRTALRNVDLTKLCSSEVANG